MSNLTRVGKTQYRITCVSPVGLLANSQHYGGIYYGIGFADLVGEIVGGVVPFSVAPELEKQPVYGWLPVATRRDNLHQALFAMGAAAQKDDDGDLYIIPLSDEVRTAIPDNRVYVNGTVDYPDAVTKVSVSEHTYVLNENDEVVTLFEGLASSERITAPSGLVVNGALVLFNEPMHNLVIDGGEIIESSVNYAVLAPSSECKLTGQKYSHTVRQVTRPETAEGGDSEKENKITVTEATLVSIANSENVADRLMSYYSSAKKLSVDIVVDAERAGTAVEITDPFGDTTKGIITSMDINMSNTLKAHAEIISDYTPSGTGNYYTNLAVLSKDGTFVVPDECQGKIRVVQIGGGDGGYCGNEGQKGGAGHSGDNGYGGEGGNPGAGGKGGRILITTIDAAPGDTFRFTIGKGGAGAEFGGTPTEGGSTTFGNLTSENGQRSNAGYTDLMDYIVYGSPGKIGVKGGDGQGSSSYNKTTLTYDGQIWFSGEHGQTLSSEYAYGIGGGGGGPAVGANGSNGLDGTISYISNYGVISGGGGNGGLGATPIAAKNAEIPGCGGHGGHGGGGGGGGGGTESGSWTGAGGAGGAGGRGGNGADGIILVYY
jgi:hypothetical protein